MKEDNPAASPRPRPTRAQPLQPDRPGRGQERASDGGESAGDEAQADPQRRQQSRDALKNVREGYDK